MPFALNSAAKPVPEGGGILPPSNAMPGSENLYLT